MDGTIQQNSLVLYKGKAARVLSAGDKLEISVQDGGSKKVRTKDIVLLHPGPCASFADLQTLAGEPEDARELLEGETCSLAELSDLVYGEFTPATAWAAWQLVADGLYFYGTPNAVEARSRADVEKEQASRERKAAEKRAWAEFIERVQQAAVTPDDADYLIDLEDLALGKSEGSRILRELCRQANPENAHALLLHIGWWDRSRNPYPRRFGVSLDVPDYPLPPLPDEERRDLTHLESFAIDDEGNTDPDDALSIDGERLWIHVADVAALVAPGSPADSHARASGANSYLPEVTIPMLPPRATEILGLGLQDISPALSFGLDIGPDGSITAVEVVTTRIRVRRMSYQEAEQELEQAPLNNILALCELFRERRRRQGAAFISLPEVKVRVRDGQVELIPLPPLKSRMLVTEAMLMAGEAAARFALEHDIPLPFTTQAPPDSLEEPQTLSAQFAYRKQFKASQMQSVAEPHAGLGLPVYARATSPLRRYLDLVVHQQLRAHLRGAPLLDSEEMLARVGAAEAVLGGVRAAERFSNRHWTLVYLQQHPEQQFTGILVEKRGPRRGLVFIPALGMDAPVNLDSDIAPDTELRLTAGEIDLAELRLSFRVEG